MMFIIVHAPPNTRHPARATRLDIHEVSAKRIVHVNNLTRHPVRATRYAPPGTRHPIRDTITIFVLYGYCYD
jgi:hypothetical protein